MNRVDRWKVVRASGKTEYRYGALPFFPGEEFSVELAGHYDRETNLVEFTEPTSVQDGPTFAEKSKAS